MSEVEIFSPAKVNLFLAVTGRREDGFHVLSSLVSQLSFGDRVRVARAGRVGGIELSCSEPSVPSDERNLAYKGADLFRNYYEISEGVRVFIEKRIPPGAGLGGGSGNASVTLRAMGNLFGEQDEEVLARLAGEIGSDCPLFLGTKPCFMRGRGEVIDRLPDELSFSLAGHRLALFKPSFSAPTVWAYRTLAADKENYSENGWAESRLSEWSTGDLALKELLFNSFEKVVFRKFPALTLLKERLEAELGLKMLLSGSGSACFVLLDEEETPEVKAIVREALGEEAFFEVATLVE
ncbi:MAG: 4-(cytidine 5'-diphospho)-2-C-methyl-D-erythritol kinase [Verrucomicrobiota bacterium]